VSTRGIGEIFLEALAVVGLLGAALTRNLANDFLRSSTDGLPKFRVMPDPPRKREGAIYPKTLEELRGLTDEELVQAHDSMVEGGGYTVGLDYYPQELSRRETERQTRTMVRLTWAVFGLTVVNVVILLIDLVCR
jgi:hypothetical protein